MCFHGASHPRASSPARTRPFTGNRLGKRMRDGFVLKCTFNVCLLMICCSCSPQVSQAGEFHAELPGCKNVPTVRLNYRNNNGLKITLVNQGTAQHITYERVVKVELLSVTPLQSGIKTLDAGESRCARKQNERKQERRFRSF